VDHQERIYEVKYLDYFGEYFSGFTLIIYICLQFEIVQIHILVLTRFQ